LTILEVVTPPLLTVQLVKLPLMPAETSENPMPPAPPAPLELMIIGTDALRR